jgi:hypothetical protein
MVKYELGGAIDLLLLPLKENGRLRKKLPIHGSGMADASVGVGFLGGSVHIRFPARLRTGTELLKYANKSRQLYKCLMNIAFAIKKIALPIEMHVS